MVQRAGLDLGSFDLATGASAPVLTPAAAPPPPPPPPVLPRRAPMAPAAVPTVAPVVPPEQVQEAARDIQMAVADAAGVGAQNQPRPSYASDAQRRATEVSRILESKLQERLKPDFGDILSASLQTLAGRGRTNFATALREEEGKELTRAYNIANALSGLQRNTTNELKPADLLRVAEDAAKRGDKRVEMVLDQIKDAARNFEDIPAAQSALLSAVMEVDSPEKTPLQVMKEAVERVRASGLASKSKTTSASYGLTKDENGFWVPAKGRRLTQSQEMSNFARARGDVAKADQIDKNMEDSASGVRKGGDFVGKFYTAKTDSEVAIGLIDRTRQLIARSPETVGGAGTLGLFIEGVGAQARAIMNSPVELGNAGETPTIVDAGVLQSNAGAQIIWNKVTSSPDLKTGFGWVDKSSDAQAIRTNLLLLAFAVARAIEPGGRLSNQDIANVLRALGQGGRDIFTSPRTLASALNEVESYVKTSLNARYRSVVAQSPDFAKSNPREPYPMGAPQPAAAPAGAPTAAPPRTGNAAQGGQRFLSPSTDAIEFLRRNPQLKGDFDKKFGPGAAARVLGN